MRATGIVRRIDDLGRIVIPKEIRRTLRIHEGDPIEIYTNRDGEIMLKKYSPVMELTEFAETFAESLAMVTDAQVLVTDREWVISVAGPRKKEYFGKEVSKELEKIMEKRVQSQVNSRKEQGISLIKNDVSNYENQIIETILSNGDCFGSVIITGVKGNRVSVDTAVSLAKAAAVFMAKQLG